jgi:hypothetical protein
LDTIRIPVAPAIDSAEKGKNVRVCQVTISEILPVSREIQTEPVVIPKNGHLLIGMGFGVNVKKNENFVGWSNESERSMDKKVLDSVEFKVVAVHKKHETELFSNTLTRDASPGATHPWRDVELDLSQFVGKKIQFRLVTSNPNATNEIQLSSPVWSNPVVHAKRPEAKHGKTNLIIVSLDTLRADRLGTYGYDRNTSPNLDKIADDSVVFEKCISSSSWTLPSHSSLFTGLSVGIHGAGSLAGNALRGEYTTLAELFSNQGYLTAAYTEGIAISGELGFYQGFDRYSNGAGITPSPSGTVEHTFQRAKDWLETHSHLPFFQFIHTYEIHEPYVPPKAYAEKFAKETEYTESPDPEVVDVEREFQIRSDLYDAEIAYTDATLGKFFDYLGEKGLLDNTIVVILSDHGERLGEHFDPSTEVPFAGHSWTLYNEVLHIPCIIHLPTGERIATRVENLVSINDLFTTLTELAEIETSNPNPDSHSLVPLFDKTSTKTYDRNVVTSELIKLNSAPFILLGVQSKSEKISLRSDFTKEGSPLNKYVKDKTLIKRNASPEISFVDYVLAHSSELDASVRFELYDLVADPLELRDLSSSKSNIPILEQLKAVLLARHRSSGSVEYREEDQILTQEQKDAFESLGYLE